MLKKYKFSSCVIAILEVCSILGMLFVFYQQRLILHYSFVFYPCCAVLFFIFLLKREVVFSFCNVLEKPIMFLSKYTYMLYLTHTLLIQPAAHFIDFTKYNMYLVLVCSVVVSFLFAILVYHLNSFAVKTLKRIWSKLVNPISEMSDGTIKNKIYDEGM